MIEDLMDFRWMKMYECAKKFYQEYGCLSVPKSYDKKLFNWVRTQRLAYKNRGVSKELRTNNFLPLSDDRVALLEKIGMDWEPSKNSNDNLWMKMYKQAEKYFEEFGTLSEIIDNENLRKWLAIQKLSYKNRSIDESERKNSYLPLSDEKVDLLEDIGMFWEPQKGGLNKIWLEMYKEAKNYYFLNGNLIIGTNYKTSDGKKLGIWVHHQRQAYKNRSIPKFYRKNKLAELTDKQVVLLEKIGMIWDANNQSCRWNLSYEMAKKYYIEHGDLFVPKSYKTVYGKSLLQWIRDQQKAVDYDRLSDEQVELLASIGIKKKKKIEEYNWDECFDMACEFYRNNGHLDIPKKFITSDGVRLGLWLDMQIRVYRSEVSLDDCYKTLSPRRIELLESIDVVWEKSRSSEQIWLENYHIALEYYELNNNLNPSQYSTSSREVKLYRWLKTQQKAYKNRMIPEEHRNFKVKPLTNEQVALLENIGMVWEDKEINDNWDSNFALAKDFYDKYGIFYQVGSVKTPDGLKIKKWISEQRYFYKKGLLPIDKVEKLESIGVIWSLHEYNFVTQSMNTSKKTMLEKRFWSFLGEYVKENKGSIESYDDVLKIVDGFIETLGSSENHYRRKM